MSRGAQYSTGIFSGFSGEKYHFRLYRRYYEVNLLPYDDVLPCLNELEGQRLGIISNGDLTEQMFKIACERAGVDIENCVYVGDDIEIDILSCIEAGMNGIWLNRKNEDLAFPEITMIHTLTELEDALPNPQNARHLPSK